MNLLIHADPGARSGFVAAWLTNVDVYNTTATDQLYDTILKSIVPSNYGILL